MGEGINCIDKFGNLEVEEIRKGRQGGPTIQTVVFFMTQQGTLVTPDVHGTLSTLDLLACGLLDSGVTLVKNTLLHVETISELTQKD